MCISNGILRIWVHLVNLHVNLIVEEKLPNMSEFACFKCTVGKRGPSREYFGVDVRCATRVVAWEDGFTKG